MRPGKASHLYCGANRRGRSERTVVGEGEPGLKESSGQPLAERTVGAVNWAVLVYAQHIEKSAHRPSPRGENIPSMGRRVP